MFWFELCNYASVNNIYKEENTKKKNSAIFSYIILLALCKHYT